MSKDKIQMQQEKIALLKKKLEARKTAEANARQIASLQKQLQGSQKKKVSPGKKK